MIKYWKLKKNKELSEYLILNKDSIWISKIDENKISINEAINEKKLFGKTFFYRFSDLKNIILDEDEYNIILNYLTNDKEKKEQSVRIEIQKADYGDFKNHLLQIFENVTLKDLSFFDKEKPIIFSILSTLGIGLFMYFSVGISSKTIWMFVSLTIIEIAVIKGFMKTPKNGKILKLN